MTIAMTMAMTTLNQTKMANTKCQGLLVGCIGCDKCRNTKETMLSGLMFQLHNQPEREWPFEDDEDEDNGDINHENDDIYGDTNTTGYKYNIGKEKCSVIHPSSVVSFTTKGHEMDLNDRGFFGNLSPMNNSNTSSNSPRSEKHQLLICGLSDENGIICNRLRNSQSEARMANGSVFCRGCNMVRTPLLKLQTEIIVSGKLQIETGIADESSEAESLSKRMIVGQGNWSNLPSKFNSHNSELDILLGNCSNSDSPSKKNGSDMKKKTETNQVKKNGKKGPGKGRKKAHDPVKNRELAVAFIKKLVCCFYYLFFTFFCVVFLNLLIFSVFFFKSLVIFNLVIALLFVFYFFLTIVALLSLLHHLVFVICSSLYLFLSLYQLLNSC